MFWGIFGGGGGDFELDGLGKKSDGDARLSSQPLLIGGADPDRQSHEPDRCEPVSVPRQGDRGNRSVIP